MTQLDGGTLGEQCWTQEQLEFDDNGYSCYAACDRGCRPAGKEWVCGPSTRYALTTGRLRVKPSTKSKVVGVFHAGDSLEQLEMADEWVRTSKGWAYHTLVADTYRDPPTLSDHTRGLQGLSLIHI